MYIKTLTYLDKSEKPAGLQKQYRYVFDRLHGQKWRMPGCKLQHSDCICKLFRGYGVLNSLEIWSENFRYFKDSLTLGLALPSASALTFGCLSSAST